MMKNVIYAALIFLILALACFSTFAADLPPVPPIPDDFKNIKISQPDPMLAREIAEFIGEWQGSWEVGHHHGGDYGEAMRVKLIIYEVSTEKIKLLYGWGDSPSGRKGGWWRGESEISMQNAGIPSFTISPPPIPNVRFHLENGLLQGFTCFLFGRPLSIDLKRITPAIGP